MSSWSTEMFDQNSSPSSCLTNSLSFREPISRLLFKRKHGTFSSFWSDIHRRQIKPGEKEKEKREGERKKEIVERKMRSNRDATIFQSIGPSFVLTFPDRGCARIKPRRRIPFDSSAHYYSLLGPITLPLSLVAVPFHSLFFHLSPSDFSPSNEQNYQRSIDEALRKKGGPFFFNFESFATIQRW